VPQTRQQFSAVSRPKFTILSGHVEEVLLFNNFISIVETCLSSEDIARESCAMVPKWRFFASCIFSEHISDMHSKFALRPHHVWKYGRHPVSCGFVHIMVKNLAPCPLNLDPLDINPVSKIRLRLPLCLLPSHYS